MNYLDSFSATAEKKQEVWQFAVGNKVVPVLEYIATGDKVLDDGGVILETALDTFQSQYPEWKKHMFWDRYPDRIHLLKALRLQTNGTCSIQAAVLLAHMLATLDHKEPINVGMMDVGSLLRQSFPDDIDELQAYLSPKFQGFAMLHVIPYVFDLATPAEWTAFPIVDNSDSIDVSAVYKSLFEIKLHDRPAIVGKFHVTAPFMDKTKISFGDHDARMLTEFNERCHRDAKTGDKPPQKVLHAMVAVGARRDSNGTMWIALQNFWADKIFVEVSYAYLAAAGAELIFINKRVTSLPHLHGVNIGLHLHAETCADKSCGVYEPCLAQALSYEERSGKLGGIIATGTAADKEQQ